MTEYYADEYPPLSHLIHELEANERAAMYPTRPPYSDEYSSFANYAQYDPLQAMVGAAAPQRTPAPLTQSAPAAAPVSGYGFDTADQAFDDAGLAKQRELEAIAKRKAELERTHQLALQRIHELERAKQAKALAAASEPKQHTAPPSQTPSSGDSASTSTSAAAADALAAERAKKDAELLEMQQALERKLREQEAQRQREQAERLKREQEAAAAAEAARQKAEAERQRRALAAAEAERKRLEAAKRKEEEARQRAAEQRERERQQQLAAEKERQRREAAIEAARQETLARERAEAKRQRRIQKQQHARLQLRFRMWRKYVRASKALPPPVKFDATRFLAAARATAAHVKPKSAIQWLFKDPSAAAAVGTKLRNPSELMRVPAPRTHSDATALERSSNWSALDVLAFVAPALWKHTSSSSERGHSLLQWKLAVGDLVDDPTSSFGSWCAAKLGIQHTGAAAPFRVFHAPSTELHAPDVAVCCRYFDAAAVDTMSEHEQRTSLSGTAALLLPLALSDVVDDRKRARWLQRVETLFLRLSAPSQVLVTLLLFANVEPSPATEYALTTIESVIRDAQLRADHVVDVEFALAPSSGDASSRSSPQLLERFTETLVSLARHWIAPRVSVSVRATELLDGAVSAALQRCAHSTSPTTIHDSVRFAIERLRDELSYQLAYQLQLELNASCGDDDVPELADITSAYPSSASSGTTDEYTALDRVLRALASVSIAELEPSTLTLAPTDVCDHYFAILAAFVDRVFAVRPADVATLELKKLVYNLLVPVHAQLVQNNAHLTPSAAAAALPWHTIFREIYAAFAETLDDLSVAVCADWRSQHAAEPLAVAPTIERHTASGFSATSTPAAVAPVALKSLKRSFGVALASSAASTASSSSSSSSTLSSLKKVSSTSMRRSVRSDPRVLELRDDIARERAASARFQHMLRRELNRWDPEAL